MTSRNNMGAELCLREKVTADWFCLDTIFGTDHKYVASSAGSGMCEWTSQMRLGIQGSLKRQELKQSFNM